MSENTGHTCNFILSESPIKMSCGQCHCIGLISDQCCEYKMCQECWTIFCTTKNWNFKLSACVNKEIDKWNFSSKIRQSINLTHLDNFGFPKNEIYKHYAAEKNGQETNQDEEINKEELNQEETNKEETNKEEPNQEEPTQEETNQEEINKEPTQEKTILVIDILAIISVNVESPRECYDMYQQIMKQLERPQNITSIQNKVMKISIGKELLNILLVVDENSRKYIKFVSKIQEMVLTKLSKIIDQKLYKAKNIFANPDKALSNEFTMMDSAKALSNEFTMMDSAKALSKEFTTMDTAKALSKEFTTMDSAKALSNEFTTMDSV